MPGTLNPQDPAAQAMIAGQGMFPVQTDPAQGMTPVPPPPPDQTLVPEGDQANPETAQSMATQEPLPPSPIPPPAKGPRPKAEEDDDPEATEIANLTLEDLIDPELLKKLREKSSNKKPIGQRLANVFVSGALEMRRPGGAREYLNDMAKEEWEATDLLAQMQTQLGMYKREALRQRTAQKTAEAKTDQQIAKAQYQESTRKIREIMTDARKMSVVGPLPPTEQEILQDPEAANQWIGQMSELIADKQFRLNVIAKQMPLYEKLARDGPTNPKTISKSFKDMVIGNGISEAEYKKEFESTGLMLESLGEQARRSKASYQSMRDASAKNIQNMIVNRDKAAERLNAALVAGNAKDAMKIQIDLEKMEKQATFEYQTAALGQAQSTASGNEELAAVFTNTAQQWQGVINNITTLKQQAVEMNVRNFNTINPEIAFNDALMGIAPKFTAMIPEAQGNPMFDFKSWLKAHANHPIAKQYWQAVLSQMLMTSGPDQGSLMTDYIDRKRTELMGSTATPAPAPVTAPGAPVGPQQQQPSAGQPASKPAGNQPQP